MKLRMIVAAMVWTALGCDDRRVDDNDGGHARNACDYIAAACDAPNDDASCRALGEAQVVSACEAELARCLGECTRAPRIDGGRADAGPADGGPIDGGPQDVTIRFAAHVGSAPFACGTTYMLGSPAVAAEAVDLRFYVYDVRLIDTAGREVPVALTDSDFQRLGVAFLDFENASEGCTQGDAETNTEIRGRVPPREYIGVAFRIGIPMALNHADLATQPPPLNRASLFWGWRFGHIFFSAVSRTVPNVEMGINANEHVTHVGSTQCDGDPANGVPVTSCARPNMPEFVLRGFDPASDTVVVDFAEVKRDVNIADNPGCHSFTAACPLPFNRLGMNWQTGGYTPSTQTVFRIE